MNKSFFLSFFLSLPLCVASSAATISPDDAIEIANNILYKNRGEKRKAPKSPSVSLTKFGNEVYIVNEATGGWVLVSSDDRIPQTVLAYSYTGSFVLDRLPESARSVLEGYAREIAAIGTQENFEMEVPEGVEVEVSPLLGETEWGQFYPYNSLCPMLNDVRTVTGCVNTAISQIMYYHKFPANGNGQFSYYWNGVELSMDFSQSEYKWDLMQPSYNRDESEESREAVAKLMYDCGIANSSDYGLSTDAALNIPGLVNFFGYDPGVFFVERDKCSRDDYESILRDELDASRPVYYSGGGSEGAHAFVCDGYDSEGYFHFNFGWDGLANGYYLTTATGYDSHPCFVASIQPNKDGIPGLWVGSSRDFIWTGECDMSCNIRGWIASGVSADIEVGLALTDETLNTIKYFSKNCFNSTTGFGVDGFTFDDEIDDGEYTLCPVYRISGENWKKVCFSENYSDHINLSVKNGVKTFSNPDVGKNDPGVECIDGLYYRFEGEEAIFTRRNNRGGCYSGSVEIPETIEFKDKVYPVVSIGENTFEESAMDNIVIGKNVREIAGGAFSIATIGKIEFADAAKLTTIGGWAFNGCRIEEIALPNGLHDIEMCAFQSSYVKKIFIPRSVTFLGPYAFNSCRELEDVYVPWEKSLDFPSCGSTPFNNCDTQSIVLHVPAGACDIYRNDEVWGIFENIVDDYVYELPPMDPGVICVDGMYYRFEGEEAIVTRRNSNEKCYSGDITIPDVIVYEDTSYPVVSIDLYTFQSSHLGHLVIGKNIRSIQMACFSFATIEKMEFQENSNLSEIIGWAFNNCQVEEISLPFGLSYIGVCSFQTCSMKRVLIPGSVATIESDAFNCCYELEDIYVPWEKSEYFPLCGSTPFNGCDTQSIVLHVPAGSTDFYRDDLIWGEFENIVDDYVYEPAPADPGVVCVDGIYYRFEGEEAIVTRRNSKEKCYSGDITIPDMIVYEEDSYPVVSIDLNTFKSSHLGRLVIGKNVKSIPISSFSKATIGELEFASNSSLDAIDNWVFKDCKIEEVKLPDGIHMIGFGCFWGSGIKTVDIPESVRFIYGCAFNSCCDLNDVYVHWRDNESFPECGEDLFSGCDLSSATLHVPSGTADSYRADPVWGEFSRIADDSDVNIETGISNIEKENPKVIKYGDGILFKGVSDNEYIDIFNAEGIRIERCHPHTMVYPGKGLFIIKIGETIFKVRL